MPKLTPWQKLDELADVLLRRERMLRHVLDRLASEVDATRTYWESATGDTFRAHTGRGHRQLHLEKAADRLHVAARLAKAAAQQNYLEQTGRPFGGADSPLPGGHGGGHAV